MRKRIPELLALLFMLSLMSQACQRAGQPAGNSGTSNATPGNANGGPPAPPKTSLKVGDAAPDFTLNDTNGTPVRLADFRGKKNVVLAFYVLAFTGG